MSRSHRIVTSAGTSAADRGSAWPCVAASSIRASEKLLLRERLMSTKPDRSRPTSGNHLLKQPIHNSSLVVPGRQSNVNLAHVAPEEWTYWQEESMRLLATGKPFSKVPTLKRAGNERARFRYTMVAIYQAEGLDRGLVGGHLSRRDADRDVRRRASEGSGTGSPGPAPAGGARAPRLVDDGPRAGEPPVPLDDAPPGRRCGGLGVAIAPPRRLGAAGRRHPVLAARRQHDRHRPVLEGPCAEGIPARGKRAHQNKRLEHFPRTWLPVPRKKMRLNQ